MGVFMKFKVNAIEIILLIIFIAVSSIVVINIKDLMNKENFDLSNGPIISEDPNVNAVNIANNIASKDTENKEKVQKTASKNSNEIVVPDNVIGVLDIASVGIRSSVKEGIDDDTLKNFVGKFQESVAPGEMGNFCVAAHNNIETEIFRNLHKVQVGDSIKVVTKKNEYIYRVTSKDVVSPDHTEVLDDTGKPEITLITCTNMAKSRVVVKGILTTQKVI